MYSPFIVSDLELFFFSYHCKQFFLPLITKVYFVSTKFELCGIVKGSHSVPLLETSPYYYHSIHKISFFLCCQLTFTQNLLEIQSPHFLPTGCLDNSVWFPPPAEFCVWRVVNTGLDFEALISACKSAEQFWKVLVLNENPLNMQQILLIVSVAFCPNLRFKKKCLKLFCQHVLLKIALLTKLIVKHGML